MAARNCIKMGKNLRLSGICSPLLRTGLRVSSSVLSSSLPSSTVLSRSFSAEVRNIEDEIKKLVAQEKVVVFMKGVPDSPKCGFSNAVVQIMRMHDVKYEAHDILQDEELRQGVKDFSNWPTIPQVYMEGEFVGGCDILLQMHQNGELVEELKKVGITSALLTEEEKK
jgi:monothiol glutaredoxin